MPRCYSLKKISGQHSSKTSGSKIATANTGCDEDVFCNGNDYISTCASKSKSARTKNRLKGRKAVDGNDDNNATGNKHKTTSNQQKNLLNTSRAAVQRKDKMNGPTSPTEATVAPVYYNCSRFETKMGKLDFLLFHIQICISPHDLLHI